MVSISSLLKVSFVCVCLNAINYIICNVNTYIGMLIKPLYYSNFPTLKFVSHLVLSVMLTSFSDFKREFLVSLYSEVFLFFMSF